MFVVAVFYNLGNCWEGEQKFTGKIFETSEKANAWMRQYAEVHFIEKYKSEIESVLLRDFQTMRLAPDTSYNTKPKFDHSQEGSKEYHRQHQIAVEIWKKEYNTPMIQKYNEWRRAQEDFVRENLYSYPVPAADPIKVAEYVKEHFYTEVIEIL
jgi:tRNA/tmRNA/rRNA uracil-C5-methylase (TrmA/RlmC/RlmD family)